MVGLKYRMRNACGFFHIIIIKYQPEGKQDEEIDRHKISLRAVLLPTLLKCF